MSDTDDEKLRLRAWYRMLLATRVLSGEIRERLRRQFGVTLPRFDVMAALYRMEEGATMTELSRFLMVSNGNVTGIIDRLVADGLVSRDVEPNDRRTFRVRLTRRGRTSFTAMAAAHESWVSELLEPVSDAELQALLKAVEHIAPKPTTGDR